MSENKIILVTGVTSGIGEAVAIRLAAEGHLVVGGARRADRLAALKRENLHVRRVDVTDRADMAAFVDEAVSEHGRVDAIVNNAGIMPLSRVDTLLVDEWDAMIDVNVRGLLNGIAAALPHFQRQGHGHFVTMASIGAHQVVPTGAVYCATKHAAWAITEGCVSNSTRRSVSPRSRPASWNPNWRKRSPIPTPRRPWKSTGPSRFRPTRSPAQSPTPSTSPRTSTSTR